MTRYKIYILLCGLIAFFLVGCTGLGGEPPIVATRPPLPTQQPVAERSVPEQAPDLVNGARIFAENCTACHGVDGSGNGELVLAEQVGDPGNFLDPATAGGQLPQEWYNTITVGRLAALMPPWQDSLTEQERWDVAMYTYTMHYTADQLATGAILYQECAECHGEAGLGDGPESERFEGGVANLADLERMTTLSEEAMNLIVAEGIRTAMPGYSDVYNEEEIAAVVAYTRTLALQNASEVVSGDGVAVPDIDDVPDPVATEAVDPDTSDVDESDTADTGADSDTEATAVAQAPDSALVDVTGRVENGTPDADVPDDITVRLLVFSGEPPVPVEAMERETQPDASGAFLFEDVVFEPGNLYLTAVEYLERDFAGNVVQGDPSLETVDIPVTIFELTDDPDSILITLSGAQVSVFEDRVEVQQILQFHNVADRVFTQSETDADGRFRSLEIPLPEDAIPMFLDDPNSYNLSEDNTFVYDLRPVMPGEQRMVQVGYMLEYGDSATVDYAVPYDLVAPVRLFLQPPGIEVESEQLPLVGEEVIGNQTYTGYGTDLELERGDRISYTLTGRPIAATNEASVTVVESDNLLPVVLMGIGALLLVSAGVLVLVRQRNAGTSDEGGTSDDAAVIDSLVAQMAALDQQHERGEINHDLYQQKRQELKAKLAALMGDTKATDD